jgi:hypothetical protein
MPVEHLAVRVDLCATADYYSCIFLFLIIDGAQVKSRAFCLAIHPAVEAADNALGACGGFARFFADDGYLVGPREEVLAALAAFETQVSGARGMRVGAQPYA